MEQKPVKTDDAVGHIYQNNRNCNGGVAVRVNYAKVKLGDRLFTADQLKAERENVIRENRHLIDIGKLVLEKFLSGNSIPVSRCVITADELSLLSNHEEEPE